MILTFPGRFTAPAILTTSFTRRNVSGSAAAARARFVSGPTATSVTVPGSCSRRMRRISSCAGFLDAMKERCAGPGPASVPPCLTVSMTLGVTSGSKRCSHVSEGVR